MANKPIAPVIIDPTSGMNAGSSDSVIGIATNVVNPSSQDFARIEVGARRSPIGLPQPALGSAAYYVDYENQSFDRSPVIFAEADYAAAPGETFADTLNFSVTNESEENIELGEWLWGVAVPQAPLLFEFSLPLTTSDWRTNGAGVVAPDTDNYIRFSPAPSKIECWTGVKGGMVIGARYRCEIDIGDVTSGTVNALAKDGDTNQTWHTAPLSANTLGVDQPFEFVALNENWQQNLQTGTTGYLQAGMMRVYGPLAT
jgi:hypothetical protein